MFLFIFLATERKGQDPMQDQVEMKEEDKKQVQKSK